tara:strand:- start:1931 stop:2278 length:348 start_codon:yes stop_codon:yes gene_type:complete
MVVSNKNKFNKKYGFKSDAPHGKAEISRLTGIPVRILDKIYYRGIGARKSNPQSVRSASTGKKSGGGSLRGKMSGPQWGYSRIYSFIMKQPGTWGKADKDLADKVRKLKIKGYMR